jgi:hypothetical protein
LGLSLAHSFFVADSRKPLTEAELEEILNDSDFYLSDDEEVVTNEVDDAIAADLADVEDPELDQLEDTDPVEDDFDSDDDVPLAVNKGSADYGSTEKFK